MKANISLCVGLVLFCGSTIAHATDCSGTVDVSNMAIGCDGEATKIVSLAQCDYRADKIPTITLSNVIDGARGNQSVSVVSTGPGSFTVRIAPVSQSYNGDGDNNSCQVQSFSWASE